MSDAIELIKEFHSATSVSPEQRADIRERYRSLSSDEVQQLADWAIETNDSEMDAILCHLACLKPGSLALFHGRLVERKLFYPAILFNGASPETSHRILNAIAESGDFDSLATSHMLAALAWIGDETVQQAFASWRQSPPPWASILHVPPHVYAKEAGWELTKEGGRRDLFSKNAILW